MKRTQSATNIAHKKKRVIYISSKQLTQIETNLLSKGLNFETTVNDLKIEEADTICVKINFALQNSKPLKDGFINNGRKALKELQFDTSIVILPADKGGSNVILNRRNIWENVRIKETMVHIEYLRKILLPKLKLKH